MARTKQEIAQEIKEDFVANTALQEVYEIDGTASFDDEFSLTSLEAALIEVIATQTKTLEDLYDIHLNEIDERLALMTPGTLDWYKRMALLFQFGHELEWNSDKLIYEYPIIDSDVQIVKVASVNEHNNKLIMKIAKLDANNDPESLQPGELDAFRIDYMERVKYAGVLINYISTTADDININMKIFYNPAILNTDGSMVDDDAVFPVEDAIKEYLHLTPFNGLFNITDLIDKLQETTGVVNPIFQFAEAKHGSEPWEEIEDYYRPYAGYMKAHTLNIEYVVQ